MFGDEILSGTGCLFSARKRSEPERAEQSRMPAEKILFSEDAIGQVEYCAKVGPNFARENSRGSGGSNPPLSSANESFSVCDSAKDDRNMRLRGQFHTARGSGERPERWFFLICGSFYP